MRSGAWGETQEDLFIASGEAIATDRHRLLVDVKAVTLHCFRVVYEVDCWKAVVVVLDV